ncbi:MAG: hypothetical protein K1000chlam4_00442 [Chlamydiae bacterium]|nr:hypothetical protein [Chlamydiota bacterium]
MTGKAEKNIFLTQTDHYNIITWSALDGPAPLNYRIYRDASLTTLVAQVSASTLRFEEHNRKKNQPYTYFIVSVNQDSTETTIGTVSVTN